MTEHIFFYLGLSFLTLHEMDAVRCRKWRIFPGLSMLDEKLAQIIFLFAHVPLFYIIFHRLTNGEDRGSFIQGFDVFMIIHVGLHILFHC